MTRPRRLSLLVLLAVCLALLPRVARAATPSCSLTTKLYFGNGVNNTRAAAEQSMWALGGLAEQAGLSNFELDLAYNQTDGLLLDVVQTIKMKLAEDDRFSWFVANNILGYTLRGLAIPSPILKQYGPLVKAIQGYVNDAIANTSGQPQLYYDSDVGQHVLQYSSDLAAGHRVIVVAHSQGNLYANASYKLLQAAAPDLLTSFGIVSVGTAAETSLNGYVTSDNDLVIGLLRTLGHTVLPWNIHVPVTLGDLTGHTFLGTYINASLPARKPVIALLSKVSEQVAFPPATCTPPASDPENATIVAAEGGAQVTGTVQPGQSNTISLSLVSGQKVDVRVVDLAHNAFSPAVTAYGPDGKPATNTFWDADVTAIGFTATKNGTYTLKISDSQSTATAVGTYAVYYALAPGSNEGGALPASAFVSGTIDQGDLDTFTFDALAGEEFALRVVDVDSGPFTPKLEVYGPTGVAAINATWTPEVTATNFKAQTSGTYTIVLSDASSHRAAAGAYKLYFARAPGANEGGTLLPGSVVSSTIGKGDLDTYTLTAQKGERVFLRVADLGSGSFVPEVGVYDPVGTAAVNSTWSPEVATTGFIASKSGAYTVIVSDNSGNRAATGAYNLYYVRAPGANTGGLLASGSVTPGNIQKGELDSYTFTAQIGEHVSVRVADIGSGDFTPSLSVLDPTGAAAVNTTWNDQVATTGFVAAKTGTYTVVIADETGNHAATGEYNLYFTRAPSANEGGLLAASSITAGSIDKGDLDSFTFTAQAGEAVAVRVTDVTANAFTPQLEIYNPDGAAAVNSTWADDVAATSFKAAKTGTYTIFVSDNSTNHAATGSYSLHLARAPGANAGGVLVPSSVTSASIDEGDVDSYTFNALAGQTVSLTVTDSSGGPLTPGVSVFDPTGTAAVNATWGPLSASVAFKAQKSGTYTVFIYDSSSGNASTGGYGLSFDSTN